MAKDTYSKSDLAEWAQTVSEWRHDGIRLDAGDERLADIAADSLGSEWGGWRVLPDKVYEIVMRAVEVGYARALGDVRGGEIEGLGEIDA